MNFWDAISLKMSNIRQSQLEKLMQENGCPDCFGKGVITYSHYEFMYGDPLICESCHGTGKYDPNSLS